MTRALYAPRPGVPLQAAVDRAHGHGLFLPTLTGDAVTSSASNPLAGTAVSDASTAHTKGAWVELTAATTAPMSGFSLSLSASTLATNTSTPCLLDVGIGAGGSEVVVVPNLGVGYAMGPNNGTRVWDCPVYIPRGSRIAVRCQSVITSKNVGVYITPWRALNTHLSTPSALVDLNANTAASYGTVLSTPGGANTKGAWTQITASAPQALQALCLCPQGSNDAAFATAGSGLIDVAVGASGSEVVVISNWPIRWDTNEWISPFAPNVWPVNVPAGARIAARYQGTNTTAALDLTILGVPA